MPQLRDYQVDIAKQGLEILNAYKFLYLALECRVGKTATSLEICRLYEVKKVLFITKLKAIYSVRKDYEDFGHDFELTIINKESIHKIESNDFDLIICDEAHSLFGTFPKANKFTKIYRSRFKKIPSILLSATMSPESYSQLFHQFWINNYAPFVNYVNFYKWASDYVTVKKKFVGTGQSINDYSNANIDMIYSKIKSHIITYTQEQAGFTQTIIEDILLVTMRPNTYAMAKAIMKHGVYEGKADVILADTGVKQQSKAHQIFSGTVIGEKGTYTIDDTKVRAIMRKFDGRKIAIFTVYQQEADMVRSLIPKCVNTPEAFNSDPTATYVGQIRSSREGVNLSTADCLVYLNIEFSSLSYIQGRDRATYKDRPTPPEVWFIMAEGGIEYEIYQRVHSKQDFTNNHFKKWQKAITNVN